MAVVGDLMVNFKVDRTELEGATKSFDLFSAGADANFRKATKGVIALQQALGKIGVSPEVLSPVTSFLQLGTKSIPAIVSGFKAMGVALLSVGKAMAAALLTPLGIALTLAGGVAYAVYQIFKQDAVEQAAAYAAQIERIKKSAEEAQTALKAMSAAAAEQQKRTAEMSKVVQLEAIVAGSDLPAEEVRRAQAQFAELASAQNVVGKASQDLAKAEDQRFSTFKKLADLRGYEAVVRARGDTEAADRLRVQITEMAKVLQLEEATVEAARKRFEQAQEFETLTGQRQAIEADVRAKAERQAIDRSYMATVSDLTDQINLLSMSEEDYSEILRQRQRDQLTAAGFTPERIDEIQSLQDTRNALEAANKALEIEKQLKEQLADLNMNEDQRAMAAAAREREQFEKRLKSMKIESDEVAKLMALYDSIESAKKQQQLTAMQQRRDELEQSVAREEESARKRVDEMRQRRESMTESLSTALGSVKVAIASPFTKQDWDAMIAQESKAQTAELRKLNQNIADMMSTIN